MPRLTVYVDDELKAEMDKVEGFNVSAAAQDGIRRAIQLHGVLKLTTTQDEAALAKIRASKAALCEREEADGRRYGREDALAWEDYEAIRNISDLLGDDMFMRTNEVDELVRMITDTLGDNPFEDYDRKPGLHYINGWVRGVHDVRIEADREPV